MMIDEIMKEILNVSWSIGIKKLSLKASKKSKAEEFQDLPDGLRESLIKESTWQCSIRHSRLNINRLRYRSL